jgi:hypothetical protein
MLGLNPGGSPQEEAHETVEQHTDKVLKELSPDWSAYRDEQWKGKSAGTHGMQPRIIHMLRQLRLDAGHVPASNVIFVRSKREKDLGEFSRFAELCWPFHKTVIERLGVRVVLCFGKSSGKWVCNQLGAQERIDDIFRENNHRRWENIPYINSKNGIVVIVATHPSIADWTKPETDPSPMVRRMVSLGL